MCPVLVSSELLLSTHLPTSEGWIAELTSKQALMVPQDMDFCCCLSWHVYVGFRFGVMNIRIRDVLVS